MDEKFGIDFDVPAFCESIKAMKPPYQCPVDSCQRNFRSHAGIQFHLFHFDHNRRLTSVNDVPHTSSMDRTIDSVLSNRDKSSEDLISRNFSGKDIVRTPSNKRNNGRDFKNLSFESSYNVSLKSNISASFMSSSSQRDESSCHDESIKIIEIFDTAGGGSALNIYDHLQLVDFDPALLLDDNVDYEEKTVAEHRNGVIGINNGNVSVVAKTKSKLPNGVPTCPEPRITLPAAVVRMVACYDAGIDPAVVSSERNEKDSPLKENIVDDSVQESVVKRKLQIKSVTADQTQSVLPEAEYIQFTEKTAEELDDEVEYDLDEEDCAWLEAINKHWLAKNSAAAPVSCETLELLIDRLEKNSVFCTRGGAPPFTSSGLSRSSSHPRAGRGRKRKRSSEKEDGQGVRVEVDEDAVCVVCLDGECHVGNVILFCDLCDIAVHQECYGVPLVPEGAWLCRRCLMSPSHAPVCCLCPGSPSGGAGGGALKRTVDGRWAHVSCAFWIPEVTFGNAAFLEPIDGVQSIPATRLRLVCYVCKLRGVGACIQCHRPNCYTAFHVSCAQHAGLYMRGTAPMRQHHRADGASVVNSLSKVAYCDRHTPAPDAAGNHVRDADNGLKIKRKLRKEVAEQTSVVGVEGMTKKQSIEAKAKSHERMLEARRSLALKRSVPPTVSFPGIPRNRLLLIKDHLKMTTRDADDFMAHLLAYWTLKRKARNGVPVLRRLQSGHMTKIRPRLSSFGAKAAGSASPIQNTWNCRYVILDDAHNTLGNGGKVTVAANSGQIRSKNKISDVQDNISEVDFDSSSALLTSTPKRFTNEKPSTKKNSLNVRRVIHDPLGVLSNAKKRKLNHFTPIENSPKSWHRVKNISRFSSLRKRSVEDPAIEGLMVKDRFKQDDSMVKRKRGRPSLHDPEQWKRAETELNGMKTSDDSLESIILDDISTVDTKRQNRSAAKRNGILQFSARSSDAHKNGAEHRFEMSSKNLKAKTRSAKKELISNNCSVESEPEKREFSLFEDVIGKGLASNRRKTKCCDVVAEEPEDNKFAAMKLHTSIDEKVKIKRPSRLRLSTSERHIIASQQQPSRRHSQADTPIVVNVPVGEPKNLSMLDEIAYDVAEGETLLEDDDMQPRVNYKKSLMTYDRINTSAGKELYSSTIICKDINIEKEDDRVVNVSGDTSKIFSETVTALENVNETGKVMGRNGKVTGRNGVSRTKNRKIVTEECTIVHEIGMHNKEVLSKKLLMEPACIGSSAEALEYGRKLRHSLEKVRLLAGLLEKRERLKSDQLKVDESTLGLRLRPLSILLNETLDKLERKDTNKFFTDPVPIDEVPDYLTVVKTPMDFSTMRAKINSHAYSCVEEFATDFDLMISNCLLYNDRTTVFYKAALKLRQAGEIIIWSAQMTEAQIGFDPDTGQHSSDPPAIDQSLLKDIGPGMSDKSLEQQLTTLFDRLEQSTRSNSCRRLTSLLRKEMSRVRRQIAQKEGNESALLNGSMADSPTKNTRSATIANCVVSFSNTKPSTATPTKHASTPKNNSLLFPLQVKDSAANPEQCASDSNIVDNFSSNLLANSVAPISPPDHYSSPRWKSSPFTRIYPGRLKVTLNLSTCLSPSKSFSKLNSTSSLTPQKFPSSAAEKSPSELPRYVDGEKSPGSQLNLTPRQYSVDILDSPVLSLRSTTRQTGSFDKGVAQNGIAETHAQRRKSRVHKNINLTSTAVSQHKVTEYVKRRRSQDTWYENGQKVEMSANSISVNLRDMDEGVIHRASSRNSLNNGSVAKLTNDIISLSDGSSIDKDHGSSSNVIANGLHRIESFAEDSRFETNQASGLLKLNIIPYENQSKTVSSNVHGGNVPLGSSDDERTVLSDTESRAGRNKTISITLANISHDPNDCGGITDNGPDSLCRTGDCSVLYDPVDTVTTDNLGLDNSSTPQTTETSMSNACCAVSNSDNYQNLIDQNSEVSTVSDNISQAVNSVSSQNCSTVNNQSFCTLMQGSTFEVLAPTTQEFGLRSKPTILDVSHISSSVESWCSANVLDVSTVNVSDDSMDAGACAVLEDDVEAEGDKTVLYVVSSDEDNDSDKMIVEIDTLPPGSELGQSSTSFVESVMISPVNVVLPSNNAGCSLPAAL